MENAQLQHLGRLLVSGEDNALLAREIMIGQGIWNSVMLCKCLNLVAPIDAYHLLSMLNKSGSTLFFNYNTKRIGFHHEPWESIARRMAYNFRPRMIYQLETAVNRTPKMLPHHIPTLPTAPEQMTASGPSGS